MNSFAVSLCRRIKLIYKENQPLSYLQLLFLREVAIHGSFQPSWKQGLALNKGRRDMKSCMSQVFSNQNNYMIVWF